VFAYFGQDDDVLVQHIQVKSSRRPSGTPDPPQNVDLALIK
jgi:hypothetical protein